MAYIVLEFHLSAYICDIRKGPLALKQHQSDRKHQQPNKQTYKLSTAIVYLTFLDFFFFLMKYEKKLKLKDQHIVAKRHWIETVEERYEYVIEL